MSEHIVEIKNVTKKYRVYKKNLQRILHEIIGLDRGEVLTALNGVDLVIEKGECVLLIGSNGAGRSTLLKIITGILDPTEGKVVVNGSTNSMISMGVGFDNDMTVRQNLLNKATLLGYTKEELKEKEAAILAFAQLEEDAEKLLKTLPPGSSARLGLASLIMQDPEVLVLDEPFFVGGRIYRQRVLEKLKELKAQGKTIILTTAAWNDGALLSDRTVLLDHGNIAFDGAFKDARKKFLEIDAASHVWRTRKKEKQEEVEEMEQSGTWEEPSDFDM